MKLAAALLVFIGALLYAVPIAVAWYRRWRDDRIIRGVGIPRLPEHWRPVERATYETRVLDDLKREGSRR